MSTLTGNKISLTYKSLIKTADNDVLGAVLKELSDGLGNNSGVFLNTGGDLKSTGTLEFSNFKATAYAVTINKLVNEADGISNNDNDTSLPTSAAVKDYVDTHVTSQDLDFSDGTNPGAVDLDSQVFAIVGTSNEIETLASGQQLQIGLPNDVTISGTYTGTTFSGDLNGTINTATTAVTQTAGDNSTKVATTAYVDTLDAASDLDFSDGSVNSAVNLNTQVFSIQGTSNEITTTASGQSLTIALDSAGVDLPDGSTAITQTAGDNSTKVATTAYVDVLDAASDLDIAGDTGTGDVNLNTQTFTLSGTTNQIITAVSGQQATFSLPSTVHRDLQGNVTGNADTATAWQTARDLSISGEATGTLSSVDGTSNISGAVTLTNSAVTGKVLTGLPTPAASTVQPSDSILEGIGKLQSQINGIANGLQFQGTWDAATNTPTLTSGGGEVDSGTTTGQTANKLIDSSQNFLTTVSVGDKVINQVDGQSALVTNVDSNTSLSLDADIMLSGEAYTIDASPFLVQGHYYVVSVGGTTSLNGNANWTIGDWVIAGADNIWSKLDHTQIDGQGTPGNLPVWNTATTLTDSIVSESGTALTVTGSLSTTLGASVTGDFAVNTNKFTVNATSGDSVIAGNLNFPDDKRIRLGTSNAFQIYYDSAAQSGQGEATITTGAFTKIESTFFKVGSSTKTAINIDANNYVRLYHNGNEKLLTTSTGVNITGAINADSADISGNVTATGTIRSNTQLRAITSSGGVSGYFTDAVNSTLQIKHASGQLQFLNGSNNIWLTEDGSTNATFGGNVLLSGYLSATSTNIGTGATRWIGSDGTTSTWFYNVPTGGNHYFAVNNTNQLSINENNAFFTGNLGIGVTPSATQTLTTQITNGLSLFGNNSTPYGFISNNHVWGSGTGDTYLVSGYGASYYKQYQGIHTWATAPSGTAGGSLTFTERMRIDSNGNVGILADNPVKTLDVRGQLAISNNVNSYWYIDRNNASGNFEILTDSDSSVFNIDTSGKILLNRSTYNFIGTNTSDAADTQRMILGGGGDASHTRGAQLQVYGNEYTGQEGDARLIAGVSGDITFLTGSSATERMRIDSSGNVGIKVTPSAWAADFSVIDMSLVGASIWASSYAANFGANIYQDTAVTYKQSGGSYGVSYYSQFDGQHRFYGNTNQGANTSFVPTIRMLIDNTGDVTIGGTGTGAKLTINGDGDELNQRSITNNNSQGYAQRNTIVSYYPSNGSATRLEIPVTSQGNLNSTTIMKIWGHSALFNDPNPLAFEATVQFGHLQTISNLAVLSSNGNIASVGFANNNPMEIFINFTTSYHNSNVNYSGCYVTIEYMTNNLSYSIQASNIALN